MAAHPMMKRPPDEFLPHPLSSATDTTPTAVVMEDYCASPRHFRSSTWSANAVPVTPPTEVIELKSGKKTPEAAATIRDLIDEPIFWRGYTSDEEVASPLVDDYDNRSFDSGSFCYDSEDVVSIHDEAPTPQRSTQSLHKAKQQGTQAQAVQFLSAGKAKVVSMSTPRIVRTAPSSPTRLPVSKMNRMNIEGRTINFSRTITPKASRENAGSWQDHETYDELPHLRRTVRRKPDVPALQAVSRSQSPSHGTKSLTGLRDGRRGGYVEPEDDEVVSPLSEATWFSQSNTPEDERPSSNNKKHAVYAEDSEPDPYPAQEAMPVPDSPPAASSNKRSSNYILQSSSARRPAYLSIGTQDAYAYTFPNSPSLTRPRLLRKLSSTFSFKTFNRPSRQDSFSSNESEKLHPLTETKKPHHPISDMHVPSRSSSKPLPKLVPRGANERAPPIVIPPCPEDYDDGADDEGELPNARWPMRKDSVPHIGAGASKDVLEAGAEKKGTAGGRGHGRKKSHSTSSGSGSS